VDYTQADCADWMVKMRRKAKLKPEQFESLARYLEEARAQGVKVGK
jgi:predicted peroxiredoxin